MKMTRQIIWAAPITLLIAGCASPTYQSSTPYDNPTVAEWQREGQLLPTGESPRVYVQPETSAVDMPKIVVESNRHDSSDLALADSIRQKLQFNRGLAPSLRNVTISVRDGRVTLRGTVK